MPYPSQFQSREVSSCIVTHLLALDVTDKASLSQIRVDTLIGSQIEFEITTEISIQFFYQIMLYYKNKLFKIKFILTQKYIKKYKRAVVHKIGITA